MTSFCGELMCFPAWLSRQLNGGKPKQMSAGMRAMLAPLLVSMGVFRVGFAVLGIDRDTRGRGAAELDIAGDFDAAGQVADGDQKQDQLAHELSILLCARSNCKTQPPATRVSRWKSRAG